MKNFFTLTLVSILIAILFLPAAMANEQLAEKLRCLVCHDKTQKRVGPPLSDIAAKYSEKDLPALVKSVLGGSQGKWGGPVPMPPQPVSEPDAEAVLRWILSGK
jgi:cytochrome c